MLGYFRALLAMGVLLTHCGLLTEEVSRSMVSCFFVVSGYLISLTLNQNYDRNPLPFYWNRFLRVYPLHIVVSIAVATTLPVYVGERMAEAHVTSVPLYLVRALTLDFQYGALFSQPSWTLSYEVFFYLLAPLIFLRGAVGAFVYAGLGIAALAVRGYLVSVFEPFALSTNWPDRLFVSMALFGIGGIVQRLAGGESRQSRWSSPVQILAIAVVASLMIGVNRFSVPSLRNTLLTDNGDVLAVATVAATLGLLLTRERGESWFSRWGGDLCYPVYLLHYPLLLWTDDYRANLVESLTRAGFLNIVGGRYIVAALVIIPLTLLLSIAWVHIERVTLRRARAGHRTPAIQHLRAPILGRLRSPLPRPTELILPD